MHGILGELPTDVIRLHDVSLERQFDAFLQAQDAIFRTDQLDEAALGVLQCFHNGVDAVEHMVAIIARSRCRFGRLVVEAAVCGFAGALGCGSEWRAHALWVSGRRWNVNPQNASGEVVCG